MPTLVIMAGGMGSRYGGLKQLDSFGKNGEKIIDYTVYDAIRAGFTKVVFVIKEENLDLFKEKVGDALSKQIEIEYVFQATDKLPAGFEPIEGRTKPLGTGHAVWCCKDVVKEPFCVVNADDYYGPEAFKKVCEFLNNSQPTHYCMAGFVLEKTLTDNGSVSRGVCKTNNEGLLIEITENTEIEKGNGVAISRKANNGNDVELPFDTPVSMNFWGFTPDFFEQLDVQLKEFLTNGLSNPLKSEFYLPFAVDKAMHQGYCDVKVLSTNDKWHGVTYIEDKPLVKEALEKLSDDGVYPSPLFE